MKNKKAFSSVIIAIIIGIIFLGAVVTVSQGWFFSQSALEVEKTKAGLAPCKLDPTMDFIVVDAINPGTAITPTPVGIVNGVYKGSVSTSTKFSKGDEVTLLMNGSGYITQAFDPITIGCGINVIEGSLSKLDGAPTVSIFNTNGNKLTDSATGGGTNQSNSTNPINLRLKMTVPSDEAIDSMVFVIEANTTEADEITLSSSQATVEKYVQNKPEFHSYESSGSEQIVRSFKVTNIEDDGMETSFNLLIEPESGKTLGSGSGDAANGEGTPVYVTWYVDQGYVEKDGTFQVGIEDVDGNAKHLATADGDYDFLIITN